MSVGERRELAGEQLADASGIDPGRCCHGRQCDGRGVSGSAPS
jgi:hypothetical protein